MVRVFSQFKGVFVVLLFFVTVVVNANAINKKPNIVIFIADDHGREVYGAYGNKVIKTPHLDQLAKEGILFNNAYATSASCSASRSVILTGLHNHRNRQYGHNHGYHHFSTDEKLKSLPVRLAGAGYRTARVGKYHIGPASVYKFDKVIKGFKANSPDGSRNTVGLVEATKSFISAKNDKPFFLYLATNDPHRDGKTNTLGDNTFGNATDNGLGMGRLNYKPENVEVPGYLPDTEATRRELAEVYQSVTRVDNGMGILIKQLKDAGVYDNTIIFYMSDNGTAMPGAKTTTYEAGLKLPLVVRIPKNYKGRSNVRVDEFVSWPDITPTVLDLAGAKYNQKDFHGHSFTAVLNGTADPNDWNEVYGSHTFHEVTMYYPMRTVRVGDYKLIYNIAHQLDYPLAADLYRSSTWQSAIKLKLSNFGERSIDEYLHRPKFELYNVKKDPAEGHNLAENSDYQVIKEQLITKLVEFQKNTEDPWIVKWEHE